MLLNKIGLLYKITLRMA